MAMSSAWTASRAAVHWWAVLTAMLTFVLLCSGGLVTSHGAGMAVPDWPNSFGYNMFLFPVSRWVGGIFYEHTHRLDRFGNRPDDGDPVDRALESRTAPLGQDFRHVRGRWGLSARASRRAAGGSDQGRDRSLSCLAGAVVLRSDLAFCAIVTSRHFVEKRWADYEPHPTLRWWALCATALIFVQLGIGATMRHEHIGLSIPGFSASLWKLAVQTPSASSDGTNQCANASPSSEMKTNACADLDSDGPSPLGCCYPSP